MVQELNYKSIFQFISQPIIVTDHLRKIVFSNNKAIELFSLVKKQIQSLHIDDFLDLTPQTLDSFKTLSIAGKKVHCTLKTKDQTQTVSVIAQGISIPLQKESGYFIEFNTDTGKKLDEENIKKLGKKTLSLSNELSNPLSVLKIQCDNFSLHAKKNKMLPSKEVIERMQKINLIADRLNTVNDELKQLSNKLTNLYIDQILDLISDSTGQDQDFH